MEKLKEHLNTIVSQLTSKSTLEDVYEQLAMLEDIDKSERDEQDGRIYSTSQVKDQFEEWVK